MANRIGDDGANNLTGTNKNDTLSGLGGNDRLSGDAGNDTLDGGTGNDLLIGGAGNDTYLFASGYGNDVIDNSGGTANDLDSIRLLNLNAVDIRLYRIGGDLVLTILASGETLTVSQYFLSADFAIDRIQFADGSRWTSSAILANLYSPPVTPTDSADTINGNPIDDTILGLGGNDTLFGNGGNDSLDGGTGADRMEGGLGNDSYVVDDAGDLVVEGSGAGDDTVQASISYSLGANVERLTLLGSANLNGTGNTQANTLNGNSGNNLLDGGAGNDTMAGGIGDDIYLVAQAGDVVSEAFGEGNDTVRATINFSLGANLENLELTGTGNLNGTGNAQANRLTGNVGNNSLNGAGGDDWMVGRRGNDTYLFALNSGNDQIDNSGGAATDVDTVQLTDLNATDLRFMRSGDDLLMRVQASSQTLTLSNFYLAADYEIDRVRFANGVIWNNATLKAAASNAVPTSTDDSVTTAEDSPVLLGVTDFGNYSDPENAPLAAVQITALPGSGALQYHNGTAWVAVTLSQVIIRTDLDAGRLRYVPASNEFGSPYASIGFKVSDGTNFALNANLLSITVTAVNDAPTLVQALGEQVASEDSPFSFTVPAGTFLDIDGDTLNYSASLANGSPLPAWLSFDAATRTLSGTPGNADVGGLGLRVTATDAGGLSVSADFGLSVVNSNNAPFVSGPVGLPVGTEDVAYSFTAAQLLANASDIDVSDTLSVQSVSVDPADGELIDLNDGTWTFIPTLNRTGVISFAVVIADMAGATVQTSASFNMAPVNDLPLTSDSSVSTLEDTPVVLGIGDFGNYSDVESTNFAAVRITTLPIVGSLEFFTGNTWLAVAQDQVIDAAEIAAGRLRFVPDLNGNGTGYATIGFNVSDGTDYALSSNTLTIDVMPINEAPEVMQGSVLFKVPQTWSAKGNAYSASLADVNSDGLLDVITANHETNSISVAINVGADQFSEAVSYSVNGSSPLTVAVADFNGDGILDVASANWISASLSVLMGNGDGTFSSPVAYATNGAGTYGVTAADVNGDGRLDLVNVNEFSATASVFIGNGDGTFGTAATYSLGAPYSYAALLYDFNGDGSLDLATQHYHGNSVSVQFNNGNGVFGVPQFYSVGGSLPAGLAGADFNGDGWIDLATGNAGSNDVSVLFNKGDGTFLLGDTYSTGGSVSGRIYSEDFNRDGWADLVTNSYGSGTVSVLINKRDGAFYAPLTIDNVGGIGVSAADMNNDGLADIVVAGYFDQTFTIIFQREPVLLYSENMLPQAIDGLLTLRDVDSPTISKVTVSIFSNFRVGQDFLTFTAKPETMSDIQGSFDELTGILELTSLGGMATLSEFQAAVRAVGYFNNSDNPDIATRGIRILADDGQATASALYSVDVRAINDTPSGSITVSGNATEGQTQTASSTLSDLDGLGPISYQWQVSDDGNVWSDITGGSGESFTLTAAEVGKQLRVEARYTDGGNTIEVVASLATTAIQAQTSLIQGGPSNDTLIGTAGKDHILGNEGDDSISGRDGDDVLDGGAGSDFLDGGAGSDSAVFSGDMSQYALAIDPRGNLTVQADASTGEAGLDRIDHLEQLRFADDTLMVVGVPGGELLVSNTTAANQIQPTITGLADGGYVVCWTSPNGIYAQRYAADGTVMGAEVQVNSTVFNGQQQPTITGLADGGYVVSWMSFGQDGSVYGIFSQRYAASNVAVGGEVLVNSTTLSEQRFPALTGLVDGGYVVCWTSLDQDGSRSGIYAQRYAVTGATVGGEVRVNSATIDHQQQPTITGLADGGYVVSWMSLNQDGSGYGVYSQRYAASGAAVGGEVRVNSTTASDQINPVITSLVDGGYVVSWMSLNQDGSGYGVYAQRYADSGGAVGGEVPVNSTIFNNQELPTITGLADGGYVVSWMSLNQDGSGYGIYAQRYSDSGAPLGGEVRVNSTTVSDQSQPTLAGLADGGYVVSWTSLKQDGSGSAIYAQRYDANNSPVENTLMLKGDEGINLIRLGSGDERVEGGGGDDSLFGGDGIDTAVYQGNQRDFELAIHNLHAWTVTDLVGVDGDEGTDSLHDVETLLFANGVRLKAAVNEMRVNSTTVSDQRAPTITSLADGGYVVSWMSLGQDGGRDIEAQRYTIVGAPLGGEVRVNSTPMSDQLEPTITGLADGGYVVSWMSDNQDGSSGGIYAQRYAASGAPLGGEVRVNSTTVFDQIQPTITGLADGGYVVSWMSFSQDGSGGGIYAQRYAANSVPMGGEVRVNSTTAGDQGGPIITSLVDGGYVVCWTSFGQDGSSGGIYAQRYAASGAPLGGEVRVNNTTVFDQIQPTITGLADGGYVVSWMSVNQDGNSGGIYAQRYAASGAPMGGEVRVNSTTAGDQKEPTITGLADGGYLVSWMSLNQDGSGGGIYAQRYAASGAPQGGEVRVNSTTVFDQIQPTITGLADGGYVVSWMSVNQDGNDGGVFAQRYDANGNALLDHLEWSGDASANTIRSTNLVDVFSGGAATDTFQFAQLPGARADQVTDFTQGADVLALNSSLFNLNGQPIADVLANVTGTQAEQNGANLVFNQSNQTLYYDADATTNGNAQAVVTLAGVASLAASDVQMFS